MRLKEIDLRVGLELKRKPLILGRFLSPHGELTLSAIPKIVGFGEAA